MLIARIVLTTTALTLGILGAPGLAQPPATPAAPKPDAAASQPERWKGSVSLPMEQSLDFSVAIQRGDPLSATMSIPMQGVSDAPLRDVEVSKERMSFTLGLPSMPKAAWAYFSATINDDGKTATGTLKQAGQELPLKMTRLAEGEAAGPKRPQEPKPPFPYTAREVTFTNPDDGATLAGTLTIPEGKGPHPAVFLITGSGPEDRDEALFGHKPFWVIADYLSRHGIAVLRADDRGVGGSTSPKPGSETTDDFAGDAIAAVEFLSKQPGINPKQIGLIGHSEGGVVAPMAAAKDKRIAFLVLLAGTGVPGRDVLELQLAAIMKANGATPEQIAEQQKDQKKILDAVLADKPDAELRDLLREIIAEQTGGQLDDKSMNQAVDAQMRTVASPWMRRFLKLDPRDALRQVACPVLALNGELDLQVIPDQNLPEIKKALEAGGNKDVTITRLPGLNHMFQHATTGSVSEYMTIEETVNPAALEAMTTWIRKRAGLDK